MRFHPQKLAFTSVKSRKRKNRTSKIVVVKFCRNKKLNNNRALSSLTFTFQNVKRR